MHSLLRPLLLALAVAALAAVAAARADEAVTHTTFSDPSKPGTLKIRVWRGRVSVHGADVKDVSVRTETLAATPTPRSDGMRVLSTSSTYLLSEKGNVVVLEYGSDGWTGAPADFDITVPKNTSVTVANSVHGDFKCSGLSGDLDVRAIDGDIRLSDLSGGIVVETMNGDITVNSAAVALSKPVSLTSMNGKVTLHVPADAKASIRFRTHHGVILTNFDEKALVTRTEVTARTSRKAAKSRSKEADDSGNKNEDERDPEPPSAPPPPDAPSTSAPTADFDSNWHNQVRESIKQAAEQAAMAAKEAAQAVHEGITEFKYEYSGTFPALPPMTGGKAVTGTLNGGGVEIQAATLNGDIILKKNE